MIGQEKHLDNEIFGGQGKVREFGGQGNWEGT